MSKLYKYQGPALNSNGTIRKSEWLAYVRAYSKPQALMLLRMRYKKIYKMCNFVVLKEKYLNEEE